MRYPLLFAALVGLASPALAQDRTLPAGSFEAAQPPIDWRQPASVPAPVYQGRSVGHRSPESWRATTADQDR